DVYKRQESVLAERVFLRTCLPQKKSEQSWDIACLEELRHLTQGLKIGAGARYFLARHYDTKDPEKTRVLLAEIAENYADDYYYFRLLENPLNTQRAWAKNFKSDGTRGAELLNALLQGDLAAAGNLRIPDELIKLEKEIQGLAKNLSGEQRLALLLLAADSRDEMRELLRKEERPQIYKILAALGHVAQKPDIALYGVKMYLREKKFAPFVAELPPLLRDMLYPRPFTELVMRYSARAGFEPAEVFALIRQESQFFPQAVSVANARGLMQLLPATARQLARQEKLTQFDLFDPQDNIRLGTAFLRQLRQNYAADFLAIAIAYNAGPGRLLEWRKKLNPDTDIFIEEIPFWETYHYVRILLADRARYRVLLSRK
ncbi:MAG: lytic transglycosylase domain-containing protein, partial [Turneriella sp.]|nr:lytic transglycosylase domain-containing protein [Turneriella sp.]